MSTLEKELTKDQLDKLPIVGERPKSEREEQYLREICQFEFYNLEEPGLSITFPYGDTRLRHNFKFFHGGRYAVPRHVARHLETRSTPIWKWRPDGKGSIQKERIGDKPRFQMRQVFV